MARRVNATDKLIERLHREHCAGLHIEVMLIPAFFAMARNMLAAGADHAAIGKAMVAFINNGGRV